MFLILSEKIRTITIDPKGKLHQWLCEQKFMKTITLKLKLIVKKMTMRFPMRTLFKIEKLEILKEQAELLYRQFFIYESKRSLKLTTDTLDCDNILVNQEIDFVTDSVSKSVRSWFMDIETQIVHKRRGFTTMQRPTWLRKSNWKNVCWQRNTISLSEKQTLNISTKHNCLPRKCFIEVFNTALDHRLSGHPGSEKTLLSLKRFFYGPRMYKGVRTLTKSSLTCRKKKIRKDPNTAPNEKWGEKAPNPVHTVHIHPSQPNEWRQAPLFGCNRVFSALHSNVSSWIN